MSAAAAELQAAIFARLSADAALTALLGGPKIHDHAPAHVAFPYVTFGRTSAFDWSTSTEDGSEQFLTLHVWSKAKGKKEMLAIMEAVRGLVHEASFAMASQALVSIRLEEIATRYDEDIGVEHGAMRFRALCEPQG